jgi:phospholipid/cholesterol/gamma-HCH transport system substrate-binding protein
VKFSKEIKVGILTVTAIVLFYFGINFLKGSSIFSNLNRYYIIYNNIGSLTTSNQVTINGFQVGRVSNIKLIQAEENRMLVTVDVESGVIVGEGAVATLISSFTSGSSIELNAGNINKPLSGGDTIKSRVQKGIIDLLTETALPVVDSLKNSIAKFNTLQDSATNIEEGIETLIKDADVALRKTRSDIGLLSSNLNDISHILKDSERGIGPLLASYKTLGDSLSRLELQATLNKTNSSLQHLDEILAKINNGEGTAGKLVNNDSLYNNLNSAARNLDLILNEFRNTPDKYIPDVNVSVFGGKDKK